MFLNGTRRLSLPWRSLWERLARRSLRDNEFSLIAASTLISIAIGLGVIVLQMAVQRLHEINFAISHGERLSTHGAPDWWRVLLVPCLGGLLSGGATILIRRWRPREIVDAIEANALFGGKMSMRDSLNLALLTIISSGFGASVGLEAAYTQLGAGMASRLGQILKVRRSDLRTLVGCGAAAGIAAAFNAPLAGAFYAFELVIGNYSPAVLAPIAMAALSSTLVVRALYGGESIFELEAQVHISGLDFALFAVLGVLAAVIAITTMTGVTRIERFLRRQTLPRWIGPTVGGLVVGLIATIYPQVLGSGHGALQLVLETSLPWTVLLGLIAASTPSAAKSA